MKKISEIIDLRDVFVFGGTVLIGAGLWKIYWPLSLIIVGGLVFCLGMNLFRARP